MAVAGGIAQPVDVIDAHAVDQAFGIEACGQGMNVLEGLIVFHTQANEPVDIEKPPPIEPVAGRLPPPQAIGLLSGISSARRQEEVAVTQIVQAIALDGHDLAPIERFLQRPAQHGQEHFVPEFGVFGFPVDVERSCVSTVAPVAQHVGPPGILDDRRHMVGDNVYDQREVLASESLDEAPQPIFSAKLRVDARGVNHIVAVQ